MAVLTREILFSRKNTVHRKKQLILLGSFLALDDILLWGQHLHHRKVESGSGNGTVWVYGLERMSCTQKPNKEIIRNLNCLKQGDSICEIRFM